MKTRKTVIALFLVTLILFSFTSCENDNRSDQTNGNAQGNLNLSNEIYDFTINILGHTYVLPAELDDFKDNGWSYAYYNDPESKEVNGNSYATCDVLKDEKKITLTVINRSDYKKKFAECKVGSIDVTFSNTNDITMTLPKKLSVNKSTSPQDIVKKWGDATHTISNESGTTLRYQNETYVFYQFVFDTNDNLTSMDIRNWNTTDEDTTNKTADSEKEAYLNSLREYKEPSAVTDDYTDYIFRLEDNLYQLPTPVSAFINNGWKITSKTGSIPAGNSINSGLSMEKGDVELLFTVKNFAAVPIETENAMITGVFINNEELKNMDFELSGGIAFGMTTTDLKAKPWASQFTVGDSVLGDVEYSYFQPSHQMYLSFKDDKLVALNFHKNRLEK